MAAEYIHLAHGADMADWGWLLAAGAVIACIAVVAFRRRDVTGPRPGACIEGPVESEVLAVLLQSGRPISESELIEAVSMAPEEATRAIGRLVASGQIRRWWSDRDQAYLLSPA